MTRTLTHSKYRQRESTQPPLGPIRDRGAYLGGSILTFFLGYCMLFFKSGFLLSAYPFSAALVLAGFDMQAYNGATQAPSIPLALLGMAAVIALTAVLLLVSRPSSKGAPVKRKKAKGWGRR